MRNIKYKCYSMVMAVCTFVSCSKMDDTYIDFIKDGEITYTKKADSVAVYPGKDRLKIAFVGLDSKVSKVKIYWNHKAESMEAPVTSSNGNLEVIVPELAEGAYSFDIYTYDKSGNKSVPQTVTGNVYGSNYNATLRVRTIKSTNINKGVASIDWFSSPAGSISTEIKYTDNSGVIRVLYAPNSEVLTSLPMFKSGRSIAFRTLFLPEPNAIDTFYSATSFRDIIQVPALLNKSLFANIKLPGDRWQAHTPNPGTWNIERAWDGITDSPNILFHATRTGFPATVTIDLGALNELTSMKVWGRTASADLFNKGNLKEFEIYGRADAPNLSDGTMTGWIKILAASSAKPSGLPIGQNTAADLAYAQAGEEFSFDANAPAVRYIRLKVLDSWGPPADNYWYFTELSFWGFEQ